MKIDIYSIMIMAISIMFVLITFYLWLKYGKEDNDMEVIEEFYPPKECNSFIISFGLEKDLEIKKMLCHYLFI